VDLPVFVVPVRTPFLAISRRYWELVALSGRRHVTDALAGHRALVEAAGEPNAEAAVIRRLASGVGGWAAHLSPEGRLRGVHPPPARSYARQLRDEVERLAVAGVHAAATLPVDDQVVVVHPLTDRRDGAGHVAGYVAVGSAGPLEPEQRHLVLAGVAVLGAKLNHRRELAVARAAGTAPVLQLLLGGEPAAARALARLVAPAVLERPHRPVVLVGAEQDVALLAESVAADERCAVVRVDGRTARALVTADASRQWLVDRVAGRAGVAGAIGPAVGWDSLPEAFGVLAGRVGGAEPGSVAEVGAADGSLLEHVDPGLIAAWAQRLLEPVLAQRADLVPALAAYLRHGGGWEPAARELGVHRHTLRARIHRVAELLGTDLQSADLQSVDATSEIWLALRALGRV
jgi:purine catabolism regulator